VIRFFLKLSRVPSHIELYDLEDDISEKKDLSSDPNFATIIDEMLLELKAVGPCPDDVQGSFELYNKATGWSSYVRCGYFKKKPWKCHEYIIDGEFIEVRVGMHKTAFQNVQTRGLCMKVQHGSFRR